ncbi:MAG: hypothetical protein AAF203_09530, partial [Pseudomonadota bacterium]
IKERGSNRSLPDEKFHVESELGVAGSFSPDPDDNNCIYFQQEVPVFNYLAGSRNIILHFKVKSLGAELGTVYKRYGFNPWDMHRQKSLSGNVWPLTAFDSNGWPEPKNLNVFGEADVIAALKGELEGQNEGASNQATLNLANVNVDPQGLNIAYFSNFDAQMDIFRQEMQAKFREVVRREGLKSGDGRYEEVQKKFNDRIQEEIDSRNGLISAHLDEKGLRITMNFSAQPQLMLHDSTGLPVDPKPIRTGRFRVYMNLFAEGHDHSGKMVLLANDLSGKGRLNGLSQTVNIGEIQNQQIAVSIPMALKRLSNYGQIKMVVKVEPLDLQGVNPFAAVYNLGEYDQWFRPQAPKLDFKNYKPLDRISYDQYISEAIKDPKGLKISTLVDPKLFFFGPLKIRFVRIMPGETATDRTLMYSVTSCVANALTGKSLRSGVQFDVVTEDKGRKHKMRRQTNQDGCITWFGFLSHKYYRKEVLVEKVANVIYAGSIDDAQKSEYESMIDKFDEDFSYFMNPWDEKWTFGWDRPDMPKSYDEELRQQQAEAPESLIFMADFRYETLGFRYAIDDFLNLKVKKAVLLKTYPYVLKYNSIVKGRNATEPLRDGIYLLKVALQKDYLDPAANG